MIRPPRPVFLNPLRIQMPVGALTSIGHRVSGVLLAAGLPIGVYLFGRSLQSEQGFAQVAGWFAFTPFKVAVLLPVWALLHHMLAGVRHLLSDIEVGSPLRAARRSAWFANIGGVVCTLVVAWIWL